MKEKTGLEKSYPGIDFGEEFKLWKNIDFGELVKSKIDDHFDQLIKKLFNNENENKSKNLTLIDHSCQNVMKFSTKRTMRPDLLKFVIL